MVIKEAIPQANQERTPRKVRLRLMVAIPLSFSLFTLASGYLTFNLCKYFFIGVGRPHPPGSESYFWILLAIFLVTALSTVAGIMVAHAITAPLKKLSSRVEILVPEKAMVAPDELDLLSNTLGEIFDSLERMKEGKSLEILSEGVITLDRESRIIQVNRVAERSLGVSSREMVGKPFREFFPDPIKYRIFLNLVENALKEGCTHIFEDIELPAGRLSGADADKKVSVRLKGKIVPKRDEYGETSGVMITFQDPSEMEQIKQWLKQADQMAGLGTMAAGIAHEIRNPLASIRGLIELTREDMSPSHPHWNYIEQVIKEVDRINNLVEEVLEFAQMEATEPVPQDVNPLLREALSSIKHRFPTKRLEVIEELDDTLPPILARPEKLSRAFENIILNAFEATPEGGRITITSSQGDGLMPGEKPARKVLLRFHNTGSFIPPEETERIFLPFYTTKTKGTGLGLPITHRTIASHGGQICVDSDKESGTTFIVELPTC
jgi:PAS domain S-box-containing protein